MKEYIFLLVIVLVLAGCQGTPRYGGGHHQDEGSHQVSRKDQSAAINYAVDPLKMGEIIDRYLGKPYTGKGIKEKGYDCSEFVGAVYLEYSSIHLPRQSEDMFKAGRIVEAGDLYFGDLVFFDTGGQGVSHVGIYIGFDEFVHASTTNGIIISNLNDKYYRKRFVGARRVLE
jgi:cell wall-associated NlpC family hydrolase